MKKILIVDDDHNVRTTLSDLLEEVGYQTHGVSSGEKAIEAVSNAEFDIILLDVIMQGMDGIDTLSELKKFKPKIPVIMITAFPSTDSAVDAVKKGASDYITKPFKLNELVFKINRSVEQARIEQDSTLHFPSIVVSFSNPLRRQIVGLISTSPNIRLMEIVKKLDISDHTKVSFHLRVLKEEGMIEQHNEKKGYLLTEEGKKTLSHLTFIENHFSK